ncbi:MAG: hypothetical protein BWX47_00651 [candidate division Hyd24-12 bacterium ADurb.Bin004]|nr:MAG: hypothetical protein BWX47_00651 [candidate division Hyd24-12 bacterium ADurb.Bin004]
MPRSHSISITDQVDMAKAIPPMIPDTGLRSITPSTRLPPATAAVARARTVAASEDGPHLEMILTRVRFIPQMHTG